MDLCAPISPVSLISRSFSCRGPPEATLLSVPERKECPKSEFMACFLLIKPEGQFGGLLLIVLCLSVLVLKFSSGVLVVNNPELVLLKVSLGASTSSK